MRNVYRISAGPLALANVSLLSLRRLSKLHTRLHRLCAVAMCFLLTLGFSAETWAQTLTYGGITFNESTDAPLKNAAGYYQITNIRQLAFVAYRVNNNATWAGNDYILTADLDITGYEWVPIGNKYYTAGNADTKHGSFGAAINYTAML